MIGDAGEGSAPAVRGGGVPVSDTSIEPGMAPQTDIDIGLLEQARSYLQALLKRTTPHDQLTIAWQSFYAQHDALIRRFSRRLRLSGADLDDCVQQVWAELVRQLPDFQYDQFRGHFRAWLFTLVRSKAADVERARRRHPTQSLNEFCPGNPVTPLHENAEGLRRHRRREAVRRAIDDLRDKVPGVTHDVLTMRWLEGQSISQIAEALKLTPEQVWFRHHRVKGKLRDSLGRQFAEDEGHP